MAPVGVLAVLFERGSRLWDVLLTHSQCVADLAVAIVDAHPEAGADRQFVYEAAMLHDIGIIGTNAPAIFCFGDSPYICHGTIGSEMLRGAGLPRHALVAERHTGSGLLLSYIVENNLPLPRRDLVPGSPEGFVLTFEEKVREEGSKRPKLVERNLHLEFANVKWTKYLIDFK